MPTEAELQVRLVRIALDPNAAPETAELVRAELEGVPQPSLEVFERLNLTPCERVISWTLFAASCDPLVRRLLRSIEPNGGPMTIDTLRYFVFGPGLTSESRRALHETGTLRRLGLITEGHDGIELSQRLLGAMIGDLTTKIASSLCRSSPEPSVDLVIASEVIEQVHDAFHRQSQVIVARGKQGYGRRSLLHTVARGIGRDVLLVAAEELSDNTEKLRLQLQAITVDIKLSGRLPLLANLDHLTADNMQTCLCTLLDENCGPLLVTAENVPALRRVSSPISIVDVPTLDFEGRQALWLKCLKQGSESDGRTLATLYPLAPALVVEAAALARASLSTETSLLDQDDVLRGIQRVTHSKLGDLARRVATKQTWSNAVLSSEQCDRIRELIARIRQRSLVYETWGFGDRVGRGLGTVALLSGPPGTGKTMVAGLVAKDLGLELFVVDTPSITSKWIGETEKNLARLFEAAEATQAILLFDEADALFGKRTEVSSSNDKHANSQTNYLLQRIESFTGTCILTTNFEHSMDAALQRRLALHLRFDVPDAEERRQIWEALLPTNAPVEPELDFELLGERFSMTGGYIRNATVRAAFMAAASKRSISMDLLIRAAEIEYEAMGKLVV